MIIVFRLFSCFLLLYFFFFSDRDILASTTRKCTGSLVKWSPKPAVFRENCYLLRTVSHPLVYVNTGIEYRFIAYSLDFLVTCCLLVIGASWFYFFVTVCVRRDGRFPWFIAGSCLHGCHKRYLKLVAGCCCSFLPVGTALQLCIAHLIVIHSSI